MILNSILKLWYKTFLLFLCKSTTKAAKKTLKIDLKLLQFISSKLHMLLNFLNLLEQFGCVRGIGRA